MAPSATSYLNSRQHRIYKAESGKFFVKGTRGGRSYDPVAHFVRRVGSPTVRAISPRSAHSPVAVKKARKVRSNKGMKRGPRALKQGQVYRRPIGPRRPRGRPVRRRLVSPGGAMGLAKLFRSIAGPKRRVVRRRRVSPGSPMGLNMLFRARKVRSNKGVKRGPRAARKTSLQKMFGM